MTKPREALGDGNAAIGAAIAVGKPRAELLSHTMGMYATFELGDGAGLQSYLDRARQLAVHFGARRFEAQCIDFEGRIQLDHGNSEDAARLLRDALELCLAVGPQFCGPIVASALALAISQAIAAATSTS